MRMYDLIHKKRLGYELTNEEIKFFVKGFTNGDIPDYQASALMMAIMFRGMTDEETSRLTMEMARSGDMVDLSMFGTRSVDKHSTGGVGDKTTLIVAPIVASLGAKVAKMSGRGLGHTGGTVDKLESIAGYKTTLSPKEFIDQVSRIGISVIGQSGNLAPCDKKLYALRDVTATVESVPLITSSIMSKKIAAGSHSIVLDIKVGSGAFMKTIEDAEKLGQNMVNIGKACGRNISAIITDMDTPLGNNIGNALEVKEAISVLKGISEGDLRTVCEELAANMIELSLGIDISESKRMVSDAINSGKAYEKFREWIFEQGGDIRQIDDSSLLPTASVKFDVLSPCDGYIRSMNAEDIGNASVILGAGRENKDDIIDMSAGIVMEKKTGDYLRRGEVIATLHASNESKISAAKEKFLAALTFSEEKVFRNPLVYKTIN